MFLTSTIILSIILCGALFKINKVKKENEKLLIDGEKLTNCLLEIGDKSLLPETKLLVENNESKLDALINKIDGSKVENIKNIAYPVIDYMKFKNDITIKRWYDEYKVYRYKLLRNDVDIELNEKQKERIKEIFKRKLVE